MILLNFLGKRELPLSREFAWARLCLSTESGTLAFHNTVRLPQVRVQCEAWSIEKEDDAFWFWNSLTEPEYIPGKSNDHQKHSCQGTIRFLLRRHARNSSFTTASPCKIELLQCHCYCLKKWTEGGQGNSPLSPEADLVLSPKEVNSVHQDLLYHVALTVISFLFPADQL